MKSARGMILRHKMNWSGLVLAAFVLLVILGTALSAEARIGYGPVTFQDATILERGEIEVDFRVDYGAGAGVELTNTSDSAVKGDYDRLDAMVGVRYGLFDKWEIGLLVPFTSLSASWDGGFSSPQNFRIAAENVIYTFDESGLGDVEAYATYVLLQEDERNPQVSTRIVVAGGGEELGVNHAVGEISYGLEVFASKSMWRGVIHGTLGYRAVGSPFDDTFNYGLAYEYPLSAKSAVTGELYGEGNVYPNLDDIANLSLGYTYAFGPAWDLKTAGSFGLAEGGPDYGLRFGLRKIFGLRQRTPVSQSPSRSQIAPPPPPSVETTPPPAGRAGTGTGSGASQPQVEIAPINKHRQAETLIRQGDEQLKAGQHFDAVLTYLQAIELDPRNDRAYNNLGNAYYYLGRYEEARKAYEKTLELKANDAGTHYNLGLAYYQLGDGASAYEEFLRASELDPNNTAAAQNAEALRAYAVQ